jgi:hypothetical protein
LCFVHENDFNRADIISNETCTSVRVVPVKSLACWSSPSRNARLKSTKHSFVRLWFWQWMLLTAAASHAFSSSSLILKIVLVHLKWETMYAWVAKPEF